MKAFNFEVYTSNPTTGETGMLQITTLTQQDKAQMYMEYLAGSLTVEQLADKYNLSVEDMFNLLFEGKQGS